MININDNDGDMIEILEIVVTTRCVYCNKHFENESLVYAIGKPYHILLHLNCAPYYNYNKAYIHSEPISFYRARSLNADTFGKQVQS